MRAADNILSIARAGGVGVDAASSRVERAEALADGTQVTEFSAVSGVTLARVEVREYARGSASTRVLDDLSQTIDLEALLSSPALTTAEGDALAAALDAEMIARYAEVSSSAAARRKRDLIVAALLNIADVAADGSFTIKGA